MSKKRAYTPGQRYHVDRNGKTSRCTASVRGCPYTTHFDTREEADSPRQRLATNIAQNEVVKFEDNIGNNLGLKNNTNTLRSASERAKIYYLQTGNKPKSPIGNFTVHLPGDQKIELNRETYDRKGNTDGEIGTRYSIRYFPDKYSYEQSIIELNSKIDYDRLIKQLDEYYADAAEKNINTEHENDDLLSYYDNTLQTISEIEVMGRGAEKTYEKLGIDIFSKANPATLDLTTDYDNSTLQSYDVAQSLRAHAAMDKKVRDVTIEITGEIDGHKGARWQVYRSNDGDWYVGSKSSVVVVAEKAKSAAEAAELVGMILEGHNVDATKNNNVSTYISQFISEVEPSIQAYQQTVTAKMNEKNDYLRAKYPEKFNNTGNRTLSNNSYNNEKTTKGSFSSKIGKLFS